MLPVVKGGLRKAIPGKLVDPLTRRIHPGYRRYLAGFLGEIQFMTKDKVSNPTVFFRGVYLKMVLVIFADELLDLPDSDGKREFRSRALNPLLQRQLRGINDHHVPRVKEEVGETPEAAANFYLILDPVDEDVQWMWRGNFIYIWPVRLSFAYMSLVATEAAYQDAFDHTEMLHTHRKDIDDEEWEGSVQL